MVSAYALVPVEREKNEKVISGIQCINAWPLVGRPIKL